MDSPKRSAAAVASLPDDAIVEILSRVPARSVQRFKCVSRAWRGLIADPLHSKRLRQTLEGFFCMSYDGNRFPKMARHFTNVSGTGEPLIDPSLSFLPRYESTDIVDSCNGLLRSCFAAAGNPLIP